MLSFEVGDCLAPRNLIPYNGSVTEIPRRLRLGRVVLNRRFQVFAVCVTALAHVATWAVPCQSPGEFGLVSSSRLEVARSVEVAEHAHHSDSSGDHHAMSHAEEPQAQNDTMLRAACLCGCSSWGSGDIAWVYASPMLPPAATLHTYHEVFAVVDRDAQPFVAVEPFVPELVPISLHS